MARTRTAAENQAFWLDRAEQYDREAKKYITAKRSEHWLKKAADARTHALTYKD